MTRGLSIFVLAAFGCLLPFSGSAPVAAPAAPSPSPPRPPQAPTAAPAVPATPPRGTRPPVFLLPGSGASGLDALFTNATLQKSCFTGLNDIWIPTLTNLTGNATCIQAALTMAYNPTTNLWTNNSNAQVSPHDFEGLTGVVGVPLDNPSNHAIWLTIVQTLQAQGYTPGQNLFGAPYDWRVSFLTLSQIGWFNRLQMSIEAAVKANNNTRAVLMGHSLGTLVSTYFLSTYTTPAWREEHIAAFVSYSGLYAGSSVAFSYFIEGSTFGFPIPASTLWPAARTWGALVQRAPVADIWGNQTLISSRTQNYTAAGMRQLLSDLNLNQQVSVYDHIQTSNANLVNVTNNDLFVDTYCIMGSGLPTPTSFFYDVPSFNGSLALSNATVTYGPGDGNINQISLDECLSLDPVKVFNLTGVNHGGVLSDPNALNALVGILQSYVNPPSAASTVFG